MLKTNRLSKEFRLTTPASFQKVYKNAKKFRYQGISILACINDQPYSRLGVSIAKKQIPRAVDRNRIRRLIREHFRVNNTEFASQLDLIVIVYSSCLELTNLEITQCLEKAWTKLVDYYERA